MTGQEEAGGRRCSADEGPSGPQPYSFSSIPYFATIRFSQLSAKRTV